MNPRGIALVYLMLMLGSPLAMASPQNSGTNQTPQSNQMIPSGQIDESNFPALTPATNEVEPPTYTVISFQASTPNNQGACRLSELSEEEVQRLKDSILTAGLVGSEISSGAAPNTNRDKVSDRNTLLIPNPTDSQTAFQKEVPTQILKPEELSLLQNQSITGPIAFGISIDDTLRAARCLSDETCAASDKMLQYRNSGTGIVGNVKDIFSSVKGDLDKTDTVFNAEDADYLRAKIESDRILNTEDANTLKVEGFSRTQNPNLMNHVRVDNTMQAGLLTNCDNGSCVVTIYSMFDKYFNSWFSGALVVSTFGPTLWGQFRKMLVNGKRFNLIKSDLLNKIPGFGQKPIATIIDKDGVAVFGPSKFFDTKTGNTGVEYFRNLKKTGQRDIDLGDAYKEAFVDLKVTTGGQYPPLEDTLFSPTGKLGSVTDLEKRTTFFAYTGKVKEYSDTVKTYNSFLDDLIKTKDPEKRLLASRGYAKIFTDTDDIVSVDLKKAFKNLSEAQFDKIVVRDSRTGLTRSLKDLDDKYFDDVLKSFTEKGNFDGVSLLEKNSDGIILYQVKPVGKPLEAVSIEKIRNGLYPPDTIVRLTNGEFYAPTVENIDVILRDQATSAGQPQFVFAGGYEPVTINGKPSTFAPSQFSEKVLVGGIMKGKVEKFSQNVESLYEAMVARDWGKGKYTNLLSKSLQTQDKLIKNYFKFYSPEGGIVITGKMYLYWFMTKGFGSDKFSIYQLPEEWTEANFTPGEQDIYKDAYVDFFANEGSDTGDIFQKVISNLPVPWVLDKISAQYTPLRNAWESLNGGNARSTPDNLAMFMFGSPACSSCSSAVDAPTSGRFDIQYSSPESVTGFFLEHGKSSDSQDKGQLLTLFAHHTNVDGKAKGADLDQINLVNARNDGETCQQVMEKIPVYGSVAKLIGAERLGAFASGIESLSYLGGGLFGTFVTLAQQGAIAPQMNECVDDKEGYFASLYVPNDSGKKESKTDTVQKNASQNALDGIRSFAEQVKKDNPDPSLPDKVIQEATGKVEEMVSKAQDLRVAEAELRVTGSSSGYLKSQEVMYFWVGGNSLIQPNRYNEEGKTIISDANGHTITLDNASGTLTVDGQIILDESKADHERLSNKNLEIPAVEIPQRINAYMLPADNNQLMVSINVRGESIVQNADLLNCIQSAVLMQSGIPLNSNNMTEAFGKAQTVSTDAFPNIVIEPGFNNGMGRILMGGQASYAATGGQASVQIYGDRSVQVTGLSNPNASNAGKMQSVLLENGSMIYKPSTQELLIWLRHHAAAVVSDKDVRNFTGTLTNTTNPNNSCEEPAIDLKVETDPATQGTKLKGDNLTAGLKKNGPFQVFETENKRFILYSKLVDGECKQFFKVIDKNTGEVYDQAIDSISQSEDGTISIKTADGLSHSLKFSDENGKPVLTYDGKSEVLRSAVGKGGSFYYDPNKGMYYAENAQLIPLSENFKNQGVGFQANPDGTVSGKAGDNVFNINTGQGGEGLFNIPSIPETVTGMLAFILLIGLICAGIYLDNRNRKTRSEKFSL